ncbi:MAG: proton-conducting transporter membrane subunit [Candidatus Hadarchaeales archaeon]
MIPHAPILSILLPLIGGFLSPITGMLAKKYGWKRAPAVLALSVMALTCVLVASMVADVWGGQFVMYELGGWSPPFGINLAVDGLGAQMALMIAGLGLLVFIYSVSYMKNETGLDHFYALMLIVVAGMMGIVLTGDMFNFYVFLEIMSVGSYALVSFKRNPEGVEGGIKYLFIGSIGTTFILISVALLYGLVGSLNIADIGAKLMLYSGNVPPALVLAFALFVTGVMVKVAMVPFHTWLPDAFTGAPTVISALLAGPAAVVGIYWVAKLPYLPFGMPVGVLLIALGLLSMVVGVLMALVQKDFKRMLAYHVISQKGYMVLGIGLGTLGSVIGAQGGLFHLLNHSTYKCLLFMCAGSVLLQAGSQKFDELGGLSKKMPFTAAIFLIGALSISGIPPMNGFVSKYCIYLSGIEIGHGWITAISVLVSVLTLASFMKAFSSVFLGPLREKMDGVKEAPKPMLASMAVMAALCVIVGLLPVIGFNVVGPAQAAAENSVSYIRNVMGENYLGMLGALS